MMTLEEYSDLAIQLVRSNLDPNLHCLTAAALGEQLRRSSQGTSWRELGFTSFLRFLEHLERNKRACLTKTPRQALAVALPGGDRQPSAAPPTYNALRKPVWGAFIFSAPAGRRFFHRNTGAVRMGITDAPNPVDEWVEIEPIREEQQKAWAQAFLNEEHLAANTDLQASLAQPHWHQDFPFALDRLGPAKRIRWNRDRSLKVAQVADEWCRRHRLEPDTVFQTSAPQRPGAILAPPVLPPGVTEAEQRRWILAALARLPTDMLLEIPLPAGLMIQAIHEHHAIRG